MQSVKGVSWEELRFHRMWNDEWTWKGHHGQAALENLTGGPSEEELATCLPSYVRATFHRLRELSFRSTTHILLLPFLKYLVEVLHYLISNYFSCHAFHALSPCVSLCCPCLMFCFNLWKTFSYRIFLILLDPGSMSSPLRSLIIQP